MRSKNLATSLRGRRRALGLGQEELAELARVSERFVRDLEHAKETARLDKVLDVIEALGLEVDLRVATGDRR